MQKLKELMMILDAKMMKKNSLYINQIQLKTATLTSRIPLLLFRKRNESSFTCKGAFMISHVFYSAHANMFPYLYLIYIYPFDTTII